ncbi:hypothetical protein C8F04DRAFT_1148645 [Mycena alexandri]|uniref:Uncharacterized protein n=1 Tax=Mycena alexandri TaxID=1745969 RepID=A0AAD6S3D5_9AGAR|nr:hypothetical protein C8F04DRAFT_1148645 [Mycena alexandri]
MMNSSSSSFSISPETTYVAELAIALQAAKKRIQELENEKLLASNEPEDGIGANEQMTVVNLAGQVLSHNYARLNEVMGEQLSTMQATFLELRRKKGDEDRPREEQRRPEQASAALQVELARERAANAELTAQNERLKTQTVSSAELREVERENAELSTRCAELQGEVATEAGLQTKYDALEQRYACSTQVRGGSAVKPTALLASSKWQHKHDALEKKLVELKRENAGLSRKITKLLQAPSKPQHDALEKRYKALRAQNANLERRLKLLRAIPDVPNANQQRAKKRKNPPAPAEAEGDSAAGGRGSRCEEAKADSNVIHKQEPSDGSQKGNEVSFLCSSNRECRQNIRCLAHQTLSFMLTTW